MKTRMRTVITICAALLAVGVTTSPTFSRGEDKFRRWAEWKKKVSLQKHEKGHERKNITREDSRKVQ